MRMTVLLVHALGMLLLVSCRSQPKATAHAPTPEEREQRLTDARWNMIDLAGAFNTYNLNHDGLPPAATWQQALIDDGLRTPEDLVSPASDGDAVEYVLVPSDELSFDRGQVLVYEDPDDHADAVIVLFHDLHVESIPRDRFEHLADTQLLSIQR